MAHGGARWQVSFPSAVCSRCTEVLALLSVFLVGPKRTEPSGGIVSPHARRSTLPLAFTGARHQLRIEHRVEAAIREMGPKRRWGGTRQVVWQVGRWDPEGGNQRDWGWDSPGGSAPRHALAGSRTGSRAVRNPARRLSSSFPLSFLKRYFRDRESSMNESLNATGLACWRIARAIGRIFRKLACSAQTHDMRT